MFNLKRKCVNTSNLKLLDDLEIELVHDFKFLGITIDYKLKWKPFINLLTMKLRKSKFIIQLSRMELDLDTKKLSIMLTFILI